MEFFAYHGCFDEEQVIGTKFLVDLYLETETKEAELTDDLSKTINYQLEIFRDIFKLTFPNKWRPLFVFKSRFPPRFIQP